MTDKQRLVDLANKWSNQAKSASDYRNDFHDGVVTGLKMAVRDLRSLIDERPTVGPDWAPEKKGGQKK